MFSEGLVRICEQYLKKGAKVYLEGQLETRKWQDQSNQDRYTTEIVANEMHMVGGKQIVGQSQYGGGQAPAAPRANNPPNNQQNNNQGYNQQNNNQSFNQPNNTQDQQSSQNQPTFDDFDDDIPF